MPSRAAISGIWHPAEHSGMFVTPSTRHTDGLPTSPPTLHAHAKFMCIATSFPLLHVSCFSQPTLFHTPVDAAQRLNHTSHIN